MDNHPRKQKQYNLYENTRLPASEMWNRNASLEPSFKISAVSVHVHNETCQGSTATLDSVCYLVYLGHYQNSVQEGSLKKPVKPLLSHVILKVFHNITYSFSFFLKYLYSWWLCFNGNSFTQFSSVNGQCIHGHQQTLVRQTASTSTPWHYTARC